MHQNKERVSVDSVDSVGSVDDSHRPTDVASHNSGCIVADANVASEILPPNRKSNASNDVKAILTRYEEFRRKRYCFFSAGFFDTGLRKAQIARELIQTSLPDDKFKEKLKTLLAREKNRWSGRGDNSLLILLFQSKPFRELVKVNTDYEIPFDEEMSVDINPIVKHLSEVLNKAKYDSPDDEDTYVPPGRRTMYGSP